MAKAATKEVAVRQEAPPPATSERPTYLEGYTGPMGTEDIDNDDITIPRLKLAQAISDEVKDGSMPEGSLFLNITQTAIWKPGDAPLPVLIVAHSKEFMLWRPRGDGEGGVLARARPVRANGVVRYKWDNPNTDFDVRVGGKVKVTWSTKEYIDQDHLDDWGSEIPSDTESGCAATAHHNYLVMLPTQDNIVAAVSLSRSGVRVAKNLNALIKMGSGKIPLAVRKFHLSTVEEVSGGGDRFMNWQFKPAGVLSNNEASTARLALEYAKSFKTGGYVVDQNDAAPKKGADMGDEVPF